MCSYLKSRNPVTMAAWKNDPFPWQRVTDSFNLNYVDIEISVPDSQDRIVQGSLILSADPGNYCNEI